jgi:hypothetical protein
MSSFAQRRLRKATVPGARRRVFYFLEVRVSKLEIRATGESFEKSRRPDGIRVIAL